MKHESETRHLPFSHQPGEQIGAGRESIIKQLGPNWVIKDVNPLNERGEPHSEGQMAWFRKPERVEGLSKEQEKLENIFGKKHFLRVHFVYGKNTEGKNEYLMIQRKIEGETLNNLIGEEYKSEKEMIKKNKEQYKEIVWGAKKAFIELGVPIDFHYGNMIRETATGNIVIIDSGFPSEEGSSVFSGTGYNPNRALIRAYQRIDRIKQHEEFLELNQHEISKLNQKYGINENTFKGQILKLDQARDKLGITAEELETEKRKDTIDGFLDIVFGENETATGKEIIVKALERIGNTDIPKRTQRILDKIELKAELSESREYWKNVIEGNS